MEECDSSSSDGSLGQILMKYRQKLKENHSPRSLAIEASQNSNASININLAASSGCSIVSGNVESESSSRKEKNISNKLTQKNIKKRQKKMVKSNTNNSSKNKNNILKTSQNSKTEQDSNFNPRTRRDYAKLTPKELNSIAKRVHVLHETGVLLSDEEEGLIPCQNRYKKSQKNKNETPLHERIQMCGTRFGQGKVGTTARNFGVSKCGCCNDVGSSNNICKKHDPVLYNDIMKGLPEDMLDKFKKREERLLQIQQRDLLKHPELIDVDDSDDPIPLPTVELSQEKRDWVQKFIDTMSVDRVDYDKPEKLNIVEGLSHKRASDVHFNIEEKLIESLDAKTILERVDFEKEKERQSKIKQTKLNEWLKFKKHVDKAMVTSTPKVVLHPEIFPDESIENSSVIRVVPSTSAITNTVLIDSISNNDVLPENSNLFTSTKIGSVLEEGDSNFSHLDRSNITLRTPRSKLIEAPRNINESKPKAPINQDQESDIMNFVESLMAGAAESIIQEAHERCERMLETANQTRTVLHDALDEVLITSDDSQDRFDCLLDDSVQIIEPKIEKTQIIIDVSDDEVAPLDDFIEAFHVASTSRPATNTRSKRPPQESPADPRRSKRSKRTNLPSISEVAPPTIAEPNHEVPKSARSLRDCPICLENLANKEISSTICGHVFCTSCITTAVRNKRKCPICCSSLTLKKIHPLFI